MSFPFPANKDNAVARLREETYRVPPGQDFTVRRFEPGDAWGVIRSFFEVYDDGYPFDTYYVPHKLIAAHERGDMISAVAVTTRGDIVAFGSLLHHAADNPRLYETGQASVIPDYRATMAILCIQECLYTMTGNGEPIDAIFGEAVSNHQVMQRVSLLFDFVETGIELALMPGAPYGRGDAPEERVSTVLTFKVLCDTPRDLYLPQVYEDVLGVLLEPLPLTRRVAVSVADLPDTDSDVDVRLFEAMGILRLMARTTGRDFGDRLDRELRKSETEGALVFQVFVNLSEPQSGRVVDMLRERGFFFGGFLPLWFGEDGLLMQKLAFTPNFDGLKLQSPQTHELLAFIRRDMEQVGQV
ncbi:MAG: hypothetical protein V3573_07575 [Desulfovibrionaceae bacterium]